MAGARREYSREYNSWSQMWARCSKPAHKDYPRYGARGIAVCARWKVFATFLLDMGPRPEGKSLDRRDNSSGYEPSNCRWATPVEQSNNRRKAVLKYEDLTGRKFGRLLVTGFSLPAGGRLWICRCECGRIRFLYGRYLKSGHTKSCGCLRRDVSRKTFATTKRARAIDMARNY